MKKLMYADSQIFDIVKRVEAGFAVSDIFGDMGFNTPSFYNWRDKYSGMDVDDVAHE